MQDRSEFDFTNTDLQFDKMPQLKLGPPIEKLKRAASRQRSVILALSANIVTNIIYARYFDPQSQSRYIIYALLIGVAVFAMYSVYQLALVVSSRSSAILYAAMMVVPVLSMLGLLVINQKATKLLQRHGIKVSFFGADPSTVDTSAS